MLTDSYIEALLVDEGLADQVWEAWNSDIIDDETAGQLWSFIVVRMRSWSTLQLMRSVIFAACGIGPK